MNEKELVERLERHRTLAPEGFAQEIMERLPAWRRRRGLWPSQGRWIAPALAGAAAALLIVFAVGKVGRPVPADGRVAIHFELHAPGAERVELLGTFNQWRQNDIVLSGPDASGHWTATVELPEGRHEYIFLVDGQQWMADPRMATHRPDGFGRVNTVIKVYGDDDKA